MDLHDPRILAMAAAQRHLVEDEYDEYAPNASGAAFFRSAALIVSPLYAVQLAMVLYSLVPLCCSNSKPLICSTIGNDALFFSGSLAIYSSLVKIAFGAFGLCLSSVPFISYSPNENCSCFLR